MFAFRLCKSLPRPRAAAFSSHARTAPLSQPLTDEQRAERRAAPEARRAAREESGAERMQPLAIDGSVRHYQRHYLVVETQYDADSWPKKLERSPAHLVAKYVGAIAEALDGDIRKSPLLVTAGMRYTGACRGPAPSTEAGEERELPSRHDILVFPENLRVLDVDAANIDTLALAALQDGCNIRELLKTENLRFEELDDAIHVLVCAHTQSKLRPAAVFNEWYSCPEFTFSSEGKSTVAAQCLNYAAPLCYPGICQASNDATMNVFVKRMLASTDPGSKPNVWFVNGGPGFASVDLESVMADVQAYMGGSINVYTMDHRGSGRSSILDCTSPDGSSGGWGDVPGCAAVLQEKYGSDLAAFSMTTVATDLATLISKFTPGQSTFVFAASYGTAVAERLMHLNPSTVNGYILDGIATTSGAGLDQFSNFSRRDSDFGEAAAAYADLCAADKTCGSKFSDKALPDTLRSLLGLYEQNPNTTCAALINDVTQLETPPVALRYALALLYADEGTRTLIPAIMYRLNRCSESDQRVLRRLFDVFYYGKTQSFPSVNSKILWFMIVASEMWESPQPSEPEMEVRFTKALASDGVMYEYVPIYCAYTKEDSPVCNELGVAGYPASPIKYARDQYFNVTATIPSHASVLLLSSKFDSQTPHKYAEALYGALKGTAKELVTFEHASHVALGSTKMSDNSSVTYGMKLLALYFHSGGDLTKLDKSCVAAMTLISFDVPTSVLHEFFSMDDAYEGTFDPSLSMPSSSSGSDSTCDIELGVDYIGNDIKSVGNRQSSACCDECSSTAGCGAWTWSSYNGGTCWLKSSKGQTRSNPNAQSGQLGSSATCTLGNGFDLSGDDIASAVGHADPGECCDVCLNHSGCRAFSWTSYQGGTCWLKSSTGTVVANPDVVSSSIMPDSCAQLQYGVDYLGDDLGSGLSEDPTNCCNMCANWDGCHAFSWNTYQGGTCWIKGSKSQTALKPGVISGTI